MAVLERTSSYFSYSLKPLIKTPKIETFVSFNMEFKLKYYRKSSKNTIIYYCNSGTARSVLLGTLPSKIHEKSRFSSNKTEKTHQNSQ